jgi:hypothetical protein
VGGGANGARRSPRGNGDNGQERFPDQLHHPFKDPGASRKRLVLILFQPPGLKNYRFVSLELDVGRAIKFRKEVVRFRVLAEDGEKQVGIPLKAWGHIKVRRRLLPFVNYYSEARHSPMNSVGIAVRWMSALPAWACFGADVLTAAWIEVSDVNHGVLRARGSAVLESEYELQIGCVATLDRARWINRIPTELDFTPE